MAKPTRNPLAELNTLPIFLHEARNGNTKAAKRLLMDLASRLHVGGTLTKAESQWLGVSLMAIAEGEDPKKVLYLKKHPGRPRGHSEEFQRLIATSVHYSAAGRHKSINKDGLSVGAYTEVSEFFEISENTAEKYYKAHIDQIMQEQQINRALHDEND